MTGRSIGPPPSMPISRGKSASSDAPGRAPISTPAFRPPAKSTRTGSGMPPILSPFELRRAWHLPAPLDLDAIRQAATAFEGHTRFQALRREPRQAGTGHHPDHPQRRNPKKRPGVTLRFHGDGFLYKMVRLMTGALSKRPGPRPGVKHRNLPRGRRRQMRLRRAGGRPLPCPRHLLRRRAAGAGCAASTGTGMITIA